MSRKGRELLRHPETKFAVFVPDLIPAYQPTYPGFSPFVDANHEKIANAPRKGISLDLGIEGWLRVEDALKLYEFAYFADGGILELGTYHGLSTSILATSVAASGQSNTITTVELDPSAADIAAKNLAAKDLDRLVTIVVGDATEVMKRLRQERREFAFCFVDHSHTYENMLSCCQLMSDLIAPGGFVVFHDYVDYRNKVRRDPSEGSEQYGVYIGVDEGLSVDEFEFYGCYGCCGVFRRRHSVYDEQGASGSFSPTALMPAAQSKIDLQSSASPFKREQDETLLPDALHPIQLYLDIMQRVLVGYVYEDPAMDQWSAKVFEPQRRYLGRDWPSKAHSMIGLKRMENVRQLSEVALREQIPGDFIETGVWRGGACIMMKAVLAAYGVKDRRIFVADSFAGLPPPQPAAFPADAEDQHHTYQELAVSLEEVEENFRKYGLLDDQVVFLKGWFKDTLPKVPVQKLALLRLDGDMYQSTIEALTYLYPKLSSGGFCIVDDGNLPGCSKAVEDFRRASDITEAIVDIDGFGMFWRKS
jgi:O-methyltransferase/8-demethyl-8-(2,3-dimethoxy-alpha-L-rhamnosyl)tetracenomycin-C 4'-O-methyltransferase